MKRHLFALLASLAVLAAVAAVAVASSHHGDRDRRENGHHRHHNRIEHFRAEHKSVFKARSSDAATVQSVHNHTLTIKLDNGAIVSGRVTRHTTLKCLAMDQSFVREDGGPRPSGGDRGDQGENNDQRDQTERDDQGDRDDVGDADDRDEHGARDNQDCRLALRTPGSKIRDATLRRTGTGAVWTRVDLDL